MKFGYTINIASVEVTKGQDKISIGEGSNVHLEYEWDKDEMLEGIKSFPQIASAIKDAIIDVVKVAKEYNASETENWNSREKNSTDNRIRERDADYAREHRASSES